MVAMATVFMVAVVEATSVRRCGFVCGSLEAWYLWVMMPWIRTLLIREQSVKLLVSFCFTQVSYWSSKTPLWNEWGGPLSERGRGGGWNSPGYETCCCVVLYCGLDIVSVFRVCCITWCPLLNSVAIRDTSGLVHWLSSWTWWKIRGIPIFFKVKEF